MTILWFVGITNAFNFIDSMDRLAVGIAGIAFAIFMTLAIFRAGIMSICIVLYAFNVSSAQLFLGDSGAQILGFILAGVAMIYTFDRPQASTWFVPIRALGISIFDATMVVASRILRHKPVFLADRTHTYHRLVGLGLDPNRDVLTIQITSILPGLLALLAESSSPIRASLIFFTVALAG